MKLTDKNKMAEWALGQILLGNVTEEMYYLVMQGPIYQNWMNGLKESIKNENNKLKKDT